MKLLSMWEPWATLYTLGLKRIETRGWGTPHRGWVAVHACKNGLTKTDLRRTLSQPEFRDALQGVVEEFAHGCIIGLVKIADCRPLQHSYWGGGMFEAYPELDTARERAFGNYSPGRYGLLARRTFRLPTPIPFKSRQGKLLELPPEVEAQIRAQWEGTTVVNVAAPNEHNGSEVRDAL